MFVIDISGSLEGKGEGRGSTSTKNGKNDGKGVDRQRRSERVPSSLSSLRLCTAESRSSGRLIPKTLFWSRSMFNAWVMFESTAVL